MALTVLRKFLKLESASGITLLMTTLVALIWANSSFSSFYQTIFSTPLEIKMNGFYSAVPAAFWINEGLMTIFFLVIGLELRREFFSKKTTGFAEALLPGIAALGGMVVPALIYLAINYQSETARGWAIPVATDIAFALGVLALFGKRVPLKLKLFLMALAIFDDVGAIIIIAFFHTKKLSWLALALSLVPILILKLMQRIQLKSVIAYVVMGVALWICLLQSGIHATVSGVMLAFLVPENVAQKLETNLHPWVAFLIMPVFALANAGVSFTGLSTDVILSYITLGIALGLFIGKQIGVLSFTWLAVRLRMARLPLHVSWRHIYGVAVLCGIGFTMSLFLGTLAFENNDPMYLIEVRLGVLLGSVLSGVVGALILFSILRRK